MSTEQMRWLLKVIQPERTVASLPGGAGLSQETHAVLLGLPPEVMDMVVATSLTAAVPGRRPGHAPAGVR